MIISPDETLIASLIAFPGKNFVIFINFIGYFLALTTVLSVEQLSAIIISKFL